MLLDSAIRNVYNNFEIDIGSKLKLVRWCLYNDQPSSPNFFNPVPLFSFTDLIMYACRIPRMSHLIVLMKVCVAFISAWWMVTYINNVFNRDGTRMAAYLRFVEQGGPITDGLQSNNTQKQVIYWVLSAKSFLILMHIRKHSFQDFTLNVPQHHEVRYHLSFWTVTSNRRRCTPIPK